MFKLTTAVATAALLLAVEGAGIAAARAEGLPKALAWTAYDVGSAGYAQSVGIGAALRNKDGITLRVLPGKNDVSRLLPLREKKVQFSAFGVGAWQAMEAMDTFGLKEWGPQNLRLLSMNVSDACTHLIIAGDIGVKSIADLKGKRIAWVKGAPSLNLNAYAIMQFGDLDWKDVQKVEFGGYGSSFDGLIDGQVDAVFTISTAGNVTKVFSSPRGGTWVPLPHADKAGWARMQKAAPYYFPVTCKEGGGVTKPFEAAGYPYPILIAYADQDEKMTYAMTKAMYDLYPTYKDSAPGNNGWAMDRQRFEWVMPFHEGAIRYYKEVGKWDAAAQAHQEELLNRVAVLQKAWKAYAASAPSGDEAFAKGWMSARADALEKAKLDPIYKTW